MSWTDSNKPGLNVLKQRLDAALDALLEVPSIEFKESAPWDVLKFHIVKCMLAMSNLRDGGMLIVGVSSRGQELTLDGISKEHFPEFNPDNCLDFISKFASPPISVTVITHRYHNKLFIAFICQEFSRVPTICKADSNGLAAGAIYIRPTGKPESRVPKNETEIRELLDLAIQHGVRRWVETGINSVALAPQQQSEDRTLSKSLDEEVADLG